MKVVSPDTMREIDRIAIEDMKIPSVVLMENAGREIAIAIREVLNRGKEPEASKIVFFCGKGNNGGDGFVAARHLANMGFDVHVFVISDFGHLKGDAALNFYIIKNMRIKISCLLKDEDLKDAWEISQDAKVIVDALFGTGLKGRLEGFIVKVVEMINKLNSFVLSVDIPSGICGVSGKVLGSAIKANQTITMALPKLGLLLYPGANFVGKLVTADIGTPFDILKTTPSQGEILETSYIRKFFKPYSPDVHKGSFGRVFIIAGSRGMTGAAALSGLSAIRSGAGLVTIGIPESLNDILEVKLTEAMTLPLSETSGSLSEEALDEALDFSQKSDVVLLGPGLSTGEETKKFVYSFVKSCDKPMVIDADALNILSDMPKLLRDIPGPKILTPHPGEMARLLNIRPLEVQEDRVGSVTNAAKRFNCIVVLKGARTLVADPYGQLWINPTGNPGMATGGSGDVLAGIIAAFLARGMDLHEAALSGVYIHGLSGDLAAYGKGEISLIANDIIEFLPQAIKEVTVLETEM